MNNSKIKYKIIKQFECGKCKKCFSSKFSMQRHVKDCGVIRSRILCTNCNKSLKNEDVLQKHRKICFGNSKKLCCESCDELFCSSFSLKRHKWRFHEEEMVGSTNYQINAYDMILETGYKNDAHKNSKIKHILNFKKISTDKPKEEYKYRFYEIDDETCCVAVEYLEDQEASISV